ncbi:MAG: Calx-beta domain-containing protein [Panacagrimonas sp.]
MAAPPVIVPTFESVGVSWAAAAPLDSRNDAQVQFRKEGETEWQEGLPMWFDSRDSEYRGSLVNLTPGTTYEVKVTGDDAFSETTTVQTWPAEFPIARTVELPTLSGNTLTITESGSPSGYVLYTAAAGSTATIDVAKHQDFNVRIQARYVIVRGLSLKGAKKHAIVLGDGSANPAGVTDVVIENNDITAWGSASVVNTSFARDGDSAIYSAAPDLTRVVIQRNRVHHPSHDASSRQEKQGGSRIPRGAVGVNLINSAGNLVIRYNEIYSDATHYLLDGISGGPDFSNTGFPHRDSDIYGNYVANVWDDAIHSGGANRNVRIWGNYLDQVFVPIGMAPNHGGPLYIWRNISHSISSGPDNLTGAPFLKIQNINPLTGVDWGGGRSYVFNNSALIPRATRGLSSFISPFTTTDPEIRNLRTLNNSMMVRGSTFYSIHAGAGRDVAFDYDLFNGRTIAPAGQELHGVRGVAALVPNWGFDPGTFTGVFAMAQGSPGYDRGVLIPNFVTAFTGAAPDIGAHEALSAPLEFGVSAYGDGGPPPPPPNPGTVQFSSASYSVSEAGPSASIMLTRTGGSAGAASVDFATTTGGTAADGSDYTGTSITANWSDGDAAAKTVNVPIIDDADDEALHETVALVLSNATGATLGTQSTASLSIADNDDPPSAGTVQFSAATYSVSEAGPVATITVTRTGGVFGAGSAIFETIAGGTATAGSDYTTVTTTVNWADSDGSTKTVDIPINNDTLDEADLETVSLRLRNATGVTLGSLTTATLSIADNDEPAPPAGAVQFSAATYSVSEAGPVATITITRTGGVFGDGSATFETITGGTAAAGGDYTAVTATVNWLDGDGSARTVNIPINNDTIDEPDETVNLRLRDALGVTLGTRSTAMLTIADNDEPPPPPTGTVQFTAASYSVDETGPVAVVTVTRVGGTFGAGTARFETTTSGSATAGSDYTAVARTLSWADGDATSKTINISINNDTLNEAAEETVSLRLRNATGVTLGAVPTATLRIIDDDEPTAPTGTVQFSNTTYSVNESGGTASITLTRSGGSLGAGSVRFETVTGGGTATAGGDYTAVSTTVSWTDGQSTSKTVTVPIFNDTTNEADEETVDLVIRNAVGVTLGTRTTAVLRIIDNDGVPTGDIRIVLVGDSTVTNHQGWGLGFSERAADNITVINRAVSGTSSKSYRNEGFWEPVLALRPDYVLIQFGHNDQPGKPPDKVTDPNTTFRANMARYVAEAREVGIQPILVTPMVRRSYGTNGRIRTPNALTPYAAATRNLAGDVGVPLVDLYDSSFEFFSDLGPNGWQQYGSTPDDITHLSTAGSRVVSRLVVRELPAALRPFFNAN